MKRKYNVGDTVRVRKDLEIDTVVGGLRVNWGMAQHAGELTTIVEVAEVMDSIAYKSLGFGYYYAEEMLEPIGATVAPESTCGT